MSSLPKSCDRYEALKLSLDERGVMTVTLSNRRWKNALTAQMSQELTTVWDDLLREPSVRVIILTGDGADFCAGTDLARPGCGSDEEDQAIRPVHPASRNVRRHIISLLDCEKPVLARVRGMAYGIGANLALGCDMVFAAPSARFCDPHVRAGLVAGDGSVLLWPLLIGMARAKQYLMTGDPIDAETAASMGLIARCVAEEELDAAVDAMADKLLRLPPHSVNYTKAALNVALRHMTGAAFEASMAYEMYSMGMADAQEASRAYLEKREGRFSGR